MDRSRPRSLRPIAGALAVGLTLSISPLVAQVARAADPLPPLADPIADGAFCDGAPSDNPFSDLGAESAPTRETILCLVATGLTAGTTPTTYTPGGQVTRRQMALFIKRLADLLDDLETGDLEALPAYDNIPDYPDVLTEDPEFQEAIGQLTQAEIVGGFPDGRFRPGEPVSRRQMAAFVNRLEDYVSGQPYSTEGDFFDDDEGDPGEGDLNALASVGIFQGDGQGNVFPGAALTRRQMANILLRAAQVHFAAGTIRSPFGEPGEAPAGEATVTVDSVGQPRTSFEGTNNLTYDFDANDSFSYQGLPITLAQFDSMLSRNDVIDVVYDPEPSGTSTFDITTDAVGAPAAPTTEVVNADGGATANDVEVTYVRPATNSPGVTYSLQRATVEVGTDDTCGTADDPAPAGAFAPVVGATEATGTGGTHVFSDDDVPDGCYAYRVVATSPVSSTTAASAPSSPGTLVPQPADTTPPTSLFAKMTTVAGEAGVFDAGDVVTVVFSEPMTQPASDATVRLYDAVPALSGADIVNGVTATFALNTAPVVVAGSGSDVRAVGTVLTITLVNEPTPVSALDATLEVPATVSSSTGIDDTSGLPWSLGESADIVVDA